MSTTIKKTYKLGVFGLIIHDSKILMLLRQKEPHMGHWICPGGKVEVGESPHDTIVREIFEETGLMINNPELKGILTESSDGDFNWINFIFVCNSFSGQLKECSEGVLKWIPLEEFKDLHTPEVDKNIIPKILEPGYFYNGKTIYDSGFNILSYEEFDTSAATA